ncbi:hypothetical protein EJ06DRAFT_92790 [Trichodelitschia bisporula]|uniref:Anaphase-promoting complex subunit 13 n=1 Tax=Trichodelitschia bisporula TaxID=703511 RepID=A0A6G1HS09_9PEZI|nr:hypothetical protein EJ06DRAFT_92790 [Trichodelitschia bisporula]
MHLMMCSVWVLDGGGKRVVMRLRQPNCCAARYGVVSHNGVDSHCGGDVGGRGRGGAAWHARPSTPNGHRHDISTSPTKINPTSCPQPHLLNSSACHYSINTHTTHRDFRPPPVKQFCFLPRKSAFNLSNHSTLQSSFLYTPPALPLHRHKRTHKMARDSSRTALHLHAPHHADLLEDFTRPPHAPNPTPPNLLHHPRPAPTWGLLAPDPIPLPPALDPPVPEDDDSDVIPPQHAAFGIARALSRPKPGAAVWRDAGDDGSVVGRSDDEYE